MEFKDENDRKEIEAIVKDELKRLEKRGLIMRDPFDEDVFIVLDHGEVKNWKGRLY